MPFSFDWFSNNIANWNKWLAHLKNKPVNAVEIGCYEGKATCWLLENVLTHPKATITCLDTFNGSEEHDEFGLKFDLVERNFMANTEKWRSKVYVFKGKSEENIKKLMVPFDFAYIDGSHKAPDVLADAVMVWPMLNPGAVLIFDDYAWDHYQKPTHNPRMGVDAFLSVYSDEYELVAKEYQVCVRKPLKPS